MALWSLSTGIEWEEQYTTHLYKSLNSTSCKLQESFYPSALPGPQRIPQTCALPQLLSFDLPQKSQNLGYFDSSKTKKSQTKPTCVLQLHRYSASKSRPHVTYKIKAQMKSSYTSPKNRERCDIQNSKSRMWTFYFQFNLNKFLYISFHQKLKLRKSNPFFIIKMVSSIFTILTSNTPHKHGEIKTWKDETIEMTDKVSELQELRHEK